MHRFPDEVDFTNANEVLARASEAEGGVERVYDLSGCVRFDSSLIGILLELARRAQAVGAACRFEGAGEKLLRLCGLYGVAPLLFGAAADAGRAAIEPASHRLHGPA